MTKQLRLALILAVLGAVAALTATGGRPLFWVDMLLGAAIWFGLGYGIGVLIWGRSKKTNQRAEVGGRSASSYVSQIPKAAPVSTPGTGIKAMACPKGHEIEPGHRFCGECGTRLEPARCPNGHQIEPGHRFCGECGAPISA